MGSTASPKEDLGDTEPSPSLSVHELVIPAV